MEFIISMDCHPFIDQTELPKQTVEQAASVMNTYESPSSIIPSRYLLLFMGFDVIRTTGSIVSSLHAAVPFGSAL